MSQEPTFEVSSQGGKFKFLNVSLYFISECKYRRPQANLVGTRGESKPRMVNIQLPISHFILTSKLRPKSPMSSGVTQEDRAATSTSRESSAFTKGSLIQLASGDTKNIEDLHTEDFIKSASICPDLSLQHSKLIRLGNSLQTQPSVTRKSNSF